MLHERVFDTGEVQIAYVEGPPAGPPLVLLHGLPGCWQEFLPLIPTLSLRWQVYALDMRGQGKSGRVPGKYRPEHYLADIKAFVQAICHEPAVLFGNSAAGLVVLSVAAQLPEQVRAVIVGDSPIDIETLTAWMSLEAFAAHFTALQELAATGWSLPRLAEHLGNLPVRLAGERETITYRQMPGMDAVSLRGWAQTISQLDPDVLAYHATGRGQAYLSGLNMDEVLSRVVCPVLLMQANPQLGALLPTAAIEWAQKVLPDATYVQLLDAGHGLGLDTWEVGPILRAVTEFLETI